LAGTSAEAAGLLASGNEAREGSSRFFAWLRGHKAAKMLLGLLLIAMTVGGALYMRKLRIQQMEQQHTKKRV